MSLGYHSYRMLFLFAAAINGDVKKDGDIHLCKSRITDCLTILARFLTHSELS